MALTFFASVPSGDSSVVSLRAHLHDECFGPGFLQTHKPQTCRVLHVNDISSFITSDSIVVGFGEHINPTPWINPLDFGSFSFSTFEQYFLNVPTSSPCWLHYLGKHCYATAPTRPVTLNF